MGKKSKALSNYADAIEELQKIIDELQDGDVDLDDLEDRVKRASEIITFCKKRLRKTEEGVNKLLEEE